MRATIVCFVFLGLLVDETRGELPNVRLNQIQVVGSHNSYHIAPAPQVMDVLSRRSPKLAHSLDYTHRPLSEQFNRLGIRQIELDLFADPTGGLYAKPGALETIEGAPPVASPDAMKQPGMKILHVQDIDYLTTVPTLVHALNEVRGWLKANPTSCPIMVMLELKQSEITGLTKPVPFHGRQLDAIDKEILSVFSRDEIILPDDVRGDHETLREAILRDGWPTLKAVRGKVFFAMDNEGVLPRSYLEGHSSLRDRVMFVSVDETDAAAAFFKINDPLGDFDKIQRVVKQGFLVRTRADSGTKESRANDPTKRDKAFASGAHFVSTDYPEPDERFSRYRCRLPHDVVARLNPVSGSGLLRVDGDLLEFDLARENRLELIAHRGGVVDDGRIENNLPAIEEAIRRGYAMLEVDIRESKDGHLVVHHDEDFLRFYGDARKVAAMTWEEMKQLKSTPGGLRPLDFEEFARACRGKIQLMLDTKGPDHTDTFFMEMERILTDHDLLSSALVIGTEQSRDFFRDKAKISVDHKRLQESIANREDVGRRYFLFEHGDMMTEAVTLAKQHGVRIVPSVNVFHYPAKQHMQRAEADIRRLRALGVRSFQIDSVYESFCRP